MPDLAEMPEFQTDVSTVNFTGALDVFGGFDDTSAPGGLLVQAPGLTLPMLWHRGSLYNLGQLGEGATQPPLDASDYAPGGNYARYWDAPQSWGRQNFLVARPKTLLIFADNDLSGGGLSDIEDWMNLNYLTNLAPLNVSVLLTSSGDFVSSLADGIPFSTSNLLTGDIPNGDNPTELFWSLPATTPDQYVGGYCFVAQLMDSTMSDDYQVSAVADVSTVLGPVSPWELTTGTGTLADSSVANIGTYLNIAKAENDCSALVNGAAQFKSFQTILYQYDVNPTSLTYINNNLDIGTYVSISPSPLLPDSTADTLISTSGGLITRKTFTNGDLTDMLAQLLADAVAFFS